jgi:glycosyltransferase involved in cell wall biosynthesis
MRVLLMSRYHPELIRGGAQQIAYELFQELRTRKGFDVTLLAAIDSTTPSLYKSGARITGFDGRPGEFLFLSRDYDQVWQKTSDVLLVESFVEFLNLTKPDVVHFHHFMRFGIDFLTLTRRVLPKAQILLTFHEFLSICAADGHMVRVTDRSLCTRASAIRCHQCLPERPPEHYFMRDMWMKTHLDAVDFFTTPSRFMIEQYVNWGLPQNKFVEVSNGQLITNSTAQNSIMPPRRNRFGFFGQLVDVKGLDILLDAAGILRSEGFDEFLIEINGDNLQFASELLRQRVEAFQRAEAARPIQSRNVVFNGSYHPHQVGVRMARVDWCIVPSVWWEVFCLVISEAWASGRPVIASNAGGPAERIKDGVDGLLFELGDARSLAHVIKRACSEEGLWEHLADSIVPPPGREIMATEFIQIYGTKNGQKIVDTAESLV